MPWRMDLFLHSQLEFLFSCRHPDFRGLALTVCGCSGTGLSALSRDITLLPHSRFEALLCPPCPPGGRRVGRRGRAARGALRLCALPRGAAPLLPHRPPAVPLP
jgi:hypothetical protein